MIDSDLSEIVPEDVEAKVKEAAEISMGTEISVEDIDNIQMLCDQVCLKKHLNHVCNFNFCCNFRFWKLRHTEASFMITSRPE
jgi:hypothetical protein